MSLITVDMIAVEGAAQADLLPEIRRVLQSCIHGSKDLLLPSMSDAETVVNFFIVACTDAGGATVIANRITRELQNFDSAFKLKPVLAYTTLAVAPGVLSLEEQIGEVCTQIERLIQAHLTARRDSMSDKILVPQGRLSVAQHAVLGRLNEHDPVPAGTAENHPTMQFFGSPPLTKSSS